MKIRPVTDDDLLYFGAHARRHTFGAPRGQEDTVRPAEVIVDVVDGAPVVRIPWIQDDRDENPVDGTVWFTFWGAGMPPVDAFITLT